LTQDNISPAIQDGSKNTARVTTDLSFPHGIAAANTNPGPIPEQLALSAAIWPARKLLSLFSD